MPQFSHLHCHTQYSLLDGANEIRKGYENLCKLCSLGYIEGLYSKFPRIDKEILEKYSEGLIATSCCIGAEIPQSILWEEPEQTEKKLKWWIDLFGEDYYIEIQRHRGLERLDGRDKTGKKILSDKSQEDVNQELLQYADKYNLKVIATNDAHYLEEEDWEPHDILLCVNTGSYINDEKRFKFSSSDFYFKTQAEMNQLFADVPFAIDNTMDIVDKVEPLELARDVLLPAFPLPAGFDDQPTYLRHLTYQGAQRRYRDITPEIKERLDFELSVINKSGYPGYFLIVQDFTSKAREMGVSVGPGRGSAAGSAVAYCLGITNIDPIKYDLLFERFLNPERVSMPDIDIDFDDVGRAKVIDYVIEQYGKNQVAQIITYGTMAARSSIKDVGRVMEIPLSDVDRVTKTFPTNLSANLQKVLADKDIDPKLKGKMASDDIEKAYNFRKMAEEKGPIGDMIRQAKKLEGSVRNTGIHACGVIITPDDITNYVPVSVAKDSDLLVSQFDNSVAEDAGLLKMDFLGLKTLTIIKDAVVMIKDNHGVDLVPDDFPLEDEKTYELFQRGETVGIFQYESPGMQKNLKELKPTVFEDLIAMNALYRPGPMAYIPDFIARKHGKQDITYDLPDNEEYLAETYGITVYQEQVMLLSQKLANFTKGEADMLRKAMGKKKKKLIDEMWPKFLEGCQTNGHPEEVCKKEIMTVRKESGKYTSLLDFVQRCSSRAVNKKCMESLALGGAFDLFTEITRSAFFAPSGSYDTFLDHLNKYGNAFQTQKEQNQVSLFGDTPDMYIDEPKIPQVEEWDKMIKLQKEKLITGIYISGHPLDDYQLELTNFVNCPLDVVEKTLDKPLRVAGIVTETMVGVSQRGSSYARFTIQDYRGSLEIWLRNEQCENYKPLLTNGTVLYIECMRCQYKGGDRSYIKVKTIRMLDTVGKDLIKSISAKLHVKDISKPLIANLIDLCENNVGEHTFKLKVVDDEQDFRLDLYSKTKLVNANYRFEQALNRMGLETKIN